MPDSVEDYIKNQQESMPIGGETPAGETPAGETPAGETPAGETPAGETPAGETPAGEVPAGEAPAGEAPAGLDELQLNTFFETEGRTKEDIKEAFSLGSKYSELEEQNSGVVQELEDLKLKHAELREELNPLSYFSSEKAYVAEQLKRKYPNMDPGSIQTAITTDLSKISDIDVLALRDAIKRPGVSGGTELTKKILASDYGIDLADDPENWDEVTLGKIERDAYDARQELGKLQDEVELPSIKSEDDLKAERALQAEEVQKQWNPILPDMGKFDKISIPGPEGSQPFEFEVPQEFKDGLGEFFGSMITAGELEPDEDTVAFMLQERNKDFIYQNLGKIREAIEADLTAKLTKKTDEELNNTTPPNDGSRPAGEVKPGGTEAWLDGQKTGLRT